MLYFEHIILKGGGQNVREYLEHIKLSLRHFYGKKNAARPHGLKFLGYIKASLLCLMVRQGFFAFKQKGVT